MLKCRAFLVLQQCRSSDIWCVVLLVIFWHRNFRSMLCPRAFPWAFKDGAQEGAHCECNYFELAFSFEPRGNYWACKKDLRIEAHRLRRSLSVSWWLVILVWHWVLFKFHPCCPNLVLEYVYFVWRIDRARVHMTWSLLIHYWNFGILRKRSFIVLSIHLLEFEEKEVHDSKNYSEVHLLSSFKKWTYWRWIISQ